MGARRGDPQQGAGCESGKALRIQLTRIAASGAWRLDGIVFPPPGPPARERMQQPELKKQPWVTPPRYDVAAVTTVREIADKSSTFPVAELNLDGRVVRYGVASTLCRWRVDTLFTKEPGTIDWMESFTPGDVFVDVGANIGLYSVYAGIV